MLKSILVILCSTFCAARLYDGGFPSKDRKACECLERVELSTPPAMFPFTLSWLPGVRPEAIEVEISQPRHTLTFWRDAGSSTEYTEYEESDE